MTQSRKIIKTLSVLEEDCEGKSVYSSSRSTVLVLGSTARRRRSSRHGASPSSVKPNHVDSTKYLPTKLLEFGIRPERWREKEPAEQARGLEAV
ncbi:unnamed protein product [Lasius platythorax]|uniref:Uncharacterized protein n=1 Tax=Lasius platythorax TaxID=488582 RepID=A0AAV2P9R4_9HYME